MDSNIFLDPVSAATGATLDNTLADMNSRAEKERREYLAGTHERIVETANKVYENQLRDREEAFARRPEAFGFKDPMSEFKMQAEKDRDEWIAKRDKESEEEYRKMVEHRNRLFAETANGEADRREQRQKDMILLNRVREIDPNLVSDAEAYAYFRRGIHAIFGGAFDDEKLLDNMGYGRNDPKRGYRELNKFLHGDKTAFLTDEQKQLSSMTDEEVGKTFGSFKVWWEKFKYGATGLVDRNQAEINEDDIRRNFTDEKRDGARLKNKIGSFLSVYQQLPPVAKDWVDKSIRADKALGEDTDDYENFGADISRVPPEMRGLAMAAFKASRATLTEGGAFYENGILGAGSTAWNMVTGIPYLLYTYIANRSYGVNDLRTRKYPNRDEQLYLKLVESGRKNAPAYEGIDGFLMQGVTGLVASMPYMWAMGMGPLGWAASAAGIAQDSYNELVMSGVDSDTALYLGVCSGVIQNIIEESQMDRVLGKNIARHEVFAFVQDFLFKMWKKKTRHAAIGAGKQITKELFRTWLSESIEEGAQGEWGALIKEFGLGNFSGSVDNALEAIERAGQEGGSQFLDSLSTTFYFGALRASGVGPYMGMKMRDALQHVPGVGSLDFVQSGTTRAYNQQEWIPEVAVDMANRLNAATVIAEQNGMKAKDMPRQGKELEVIVNDHRWNAGESFTYNGNEYVVDAEGVPYRDTMNGERIAFGTDVDGATVATVQKFMTAEERYAWDTIQEERARSVNDGIGKAYKAYGEARTDEERMRALRKLGFVNGAETIADAYFRSVAFLQLTSEFEAHKAELENLLTHSNSDISPEYLSGMFGDIVTQARSVINTNGEQVTELDLVVGENDKGEKVVRTFVFQRVGERRDENGEIIDKGLLGDKDKEQFRIEAYNALKREGKIGDTTQGAVLSEEDAIKALKNVGANAKFEELLDGKRVDTHGEYVPAGGVSIGVRLADGTVQTISMEALIRLTAPTAWNMFNGGSVVEAFHESGHAILHAAIDAGLLTQEQIDIINKIFPGTGVVAKEGDIFKDEEGIVNAFAAWMLNKALGITDNDSPKGKAMGILGNAFAKIAKVFNGGREQFEEARAPHSAIDSGTITADELFERMANGTISGMPVTGGIEVYETGSAQAKVILESPNQRTVAHPPEPEAEQAAEETQGEVTQDGETQGESVAESATEPVAPSAEQKVVGWNYSSPSGVNVGGYWVVVDLNELVTSNMATYPDELRDVNKLNAKTRKEIKSAILRGDFKPEMITNGMLIVGGGLNVVAGNDLVIALRVVAQMGNYDAYRQAVESQVKELGLTIPPVVNTPVVVRRISTVKVDKIGIGRTAEQAKSEALQQLAKEYKSELMKNPVSEEALAARKAFIERAAQFSYSNFVGQYEAQHGPSAIGFWLSNGKRLMSDPRGKNDGKHGMGYDAFVNATDGNAKAARMLLGPTKGRMTGEITDALREYFGDGNGRYLASDTNNITDEEGLTNLINDFFEQVEEYRKWVADGAKDFMEEHYSELESQGGFDPAAFDVDAFDAMDGSEFGSNDTNPDVLYAVSERKYYQIPFSEGLVRAIDSENPDIRYPVGVSVTPKEVERMNEEAMRNASALRDVEYLDAVRSGDLETAERMTAEAGIAGAPVEFDKDGNVLPLSVRYAITFHGGNKDGTRNYMIFKEEDAKNVNHERFSIRVVGDKRVAILDRTTEFAKMNWKDIDSVRDYIITQIGKGAIAVSDGHRVEIGKDLPDEYTHSNYAQKARRYKPLLKLRAKASAHFDELIFVSEPRKTENAKHKSREGGVYYKRKTLFGIIGHEKSAVYEGELVTYAHNGNEYLYDIVNMKKNSPLTVALQKSSPDRSGGRNPSANRDESKEIVSQSPSDVKPTTGEKLWYVGERSGDWVNIATAAIVAKLREGKTVYRSDVKRMMGNVASGDEIEDVIRRANGIYEQLKDERYSEMTSAQVFSVAMNAAQRGRIMDLANEQHAKGYKLGREDEQAVNRLKEMNRLNMRAMLNAVTGYTAAQCELDYGVDFVQTVLDSNLPPVKGKNNKPGENVKADDKEGGEGDGDNGGAVGEDAGEVGSGNGEAAKPEVPKETLAKRKEIEERARKRADVDRATRELNGETSGGRADNSNKNDTQDGEKSGGKDTDGDEEKNGGIGEDGDKRPDIFADIPKDKIDAKDPIHFRALIEEMVIDRMERDNVKFNKHDPFKTPLARRLLQKTAQHILRLVSHKLNASAAREIINRHIDRIADVKYIETTERMIEECYGMIQEKLVRENIGEMLKNLVEKGDKLARNGRIFSTIKPKWQDKVAKNVEQQWRLIRSYVYMSGDALQIELNKLTAMRDNFTKSLSGDADLMGNDLGFNTVAMKLAMLTRYGGLKNHSRAEVKDACDEILKWLSEEAGKHEQEMLERKAQMREEANTIAAAAVTPVKLKPQTGIFGRTVDAMNGIFINRLREIGTYAKGELAERFDKVVEEWHYRIQDASQRKETYRARAHEAFEKVMTELYGSLKEGLTHLNTELDESDSVLVSKQGVRMTVDNLLQIGVSIVQADYAENVRFHNRNGEWLGHFNAVCNKYLTEADIAFVQWLREWYRQNLSEINDGVLVPITGVRAFSPNVLDYMPVQMLVEGSFPAMRVKAVTFIPGSMTPRISNLRDFDERAGVLQMWNSRLEDSANAIAWGVVGSELAQILSMRESDEGPYKPYVLNAIGRYHGDVFKSNFLNHLMDILRGGKADDVGGGEELEFADKARGIITMTALSGNIGTALKQSLSSIVFAVNRDINLGNILRWTLDYFSPEGREAVKELKSSDGFITRYGTGPTEAISNAMRVAKGGNWIGWLYNKGFGVILKGESIPCLWMGQGLYRTLKAGFIDQGMDEATAKKRAMTLTWATIEETQQSKLTQNLTATQRSGGGLGRFIYQFASSQVQQMAWQNHAIKQALARKDKASVMQAVRCVMINHVFLPALFAFATYVWGTVLGYNREPDKKNDWFYTLIVTMALGPFARMFMIGAAAEALIDGLFRIKTDVAGTGLPSDKFTDLMRVGGVTINDLVNIRTDDLINDLLKVVKMTSAPARQAVQAFENWTPIGQDLKRRRNQRNGK